MTGNDQRSTGISLGDAANGCRPVAQRGIGGIAQRRRRHALDEAAAEKDVLARKPDDDVIAAVAGTRVKELEAVGILPGSYRQTGHGDRRGQSVRDSQIAGETKADDRDAAPDKLSDAAGAVL